MLCTALVYKGLKSCHLHIQSSAQASNLPMENEESSGDFSGGLTAYAAGHINGIHLGNNK